MPEIITQIKDFSCLKKILEQNPGLVILKFGADWCGPCKTIEPVVEHWIKTSPSNVQFCVINTDKNPEIYSFFKTKIKLRGIPAILCWKKENLEYYPDDIVIGGSINIVNNFFEKCRSLL